MLKNSQRQKKPGGAGSSGSRVRHERVEGEGREGRGVTDSENNTSSHLADHNHSINYLNLPYRGPHESKHETVEERRDFFGSVVGYIHNHLPT